MIGSIAEINSKVDIMILNQQQMHDSLEDLKKG
jgi:hypothetical protein